MIDPNWTDIGQCVGTWVVGLVGFYFLHKQNKILERQNKIFEDQGTLIGNQIEANNALIIAERDRQHEKVLKDAALSLYHVVVKDPEKIDEIVIDLERKGISIDSLKLAMTDLGRGDGPVGFGRIHAIIGGIQARYTRRKAAEDLKASGVFDKK